MKVLSLWQPHASLCVIVNRATGLPYKTIETRSWKPPASLIGQRIAIHAAARPPTREQVGAFSAAPTLTGEGDGWSLWMHDSLRPRSGAHCRLPLGSIVGTVVLADGVPMVEPCTIGGHGPLGQRVLQVDGHALDLIDRWPHGGQVIAHHEDQRPYGLFEPGRFAWLLTDAEPVDPPEPFKGGQGLSKTWEPSSTLGACEA